MSDDSSRDQLALIRVDGMHCHKCEETIRKALSKIPGVREVEVDFNSHQASVLFDHALVSMTQLVSAVSRSGYSVPSFTQTQADRTAP
jgi:copper chaperone CopZ